MSELTDMAIGFAALAHDGQLRKYTKEDYIEHPMRVMGILSTVCTDENMLAAAILHDTVEDTFVTIEQIEKYFGADVADLVGDLTDIANPEDGPRPVRVAKNREHSAKASIRAKTIKLADLIDNSRCIAEHDEHFAKVYMNEKRLLLERIQDADPTLLAAATTIVNDYYKDKE